MEEPAYSLQTAETVPDAKVLFGLAPGPNRWPRLTVIGGSPGKLVGVNELIELSEALHLAARLVAPPATVTALSWLKPIPLVGAPARLEETLAGSNVVLAGLGLTLSSEVQIAVDRWLAEAYLPTLVTDELVPIYRTHPALQERAELLPIISIAQLVKLFQAIEGRVELARERGIFAVGALLANLPVAGDLVITYDSERIYSYLRSVHTVVHTPIPAGISIDEVRVRLCLALCLTRWTARSSDQKALELLQTAHYLLALSFGAGNSAEVGASWRRALQPSD